jgi:trehalose 6-phosphate phosphatase
VLVEDKGLTGSIHYRRLPPEFWKPLKKIIQTELGSRRQELKLTEGKKVFEIRPNIQWDKGQGVLELMGWLDLRETTLRIYIGDDQTDEDAFKVFNRPAFTILVGDRQVTNARYHLADVDHVWKFMRALFMLIATPKKGIFNNQRRN